MWALLWEWGPKTWPSQYKLGDIRNSYYGTHCAFKEGTPYVRELMLREHLWQIRLSLGNEAACSSTCLPSDECGQPCLWICICHVQACTPPGILIFWCKYWSCVSIVCCGWFHACLTPVFPHVLAASLKNSPYTDIPGQIMTLSFYSALLLIQYLPLTNLSPMHIYAPKNMQSKDSMMISLEKAGWRETTVYLLYSSTQ